MMRHIPIGSQALLTFKEVEELLQCGAHTLSRLIKTNQFPTPIKMPTNCGPKGKRFFKYKEVMEWLDDLQKGTLKHYDANPVVLKRHNPWWGEVNVQRLARLKKTVTMGHKRKFEGEV